MPRFTLWIYRWPIFPAGHSRRRRRARVPLHINCHSNLKFLQRHSRFRLSHSYRRIVEYLNMIDANFAIVYVAIAVVACAAKKLISQPPTTTLRTSLSSFLTRVLLLACVCGMAIPGFAASSNASQPLAATPPMGWNDWAHYQCGFTAQTILANANALV